MKRSRHLARWQWALVIGVLIVLFALRVANPPPYADDQTSSPALAQTVTLMVIVGGVIILVAVVAGIIRLLIAAYWSGPRKPK
jgi:hypothetical protein